MAINIPVFVSKEKLNSCSNSNFFLSLYFFHSSKKRVKKAPTEVFVIFFRTRK